MKRKKIFSSVFVLLVSVCLFVFVAPAFAGEESPSVGGKAVKGVANVAFGWTEVVQSPAEGVRDHGPLGFFSGLVLFPVKAAIRIVGGAADFITSPVPEKGLVKDYPLESLAFGK